MNRILFLLILSATAACNDAKKSSLKVKDTVVKDTIASPLATTLTPDTTLRTKSNDSIIPGKSIGHVSIDEKMEDVIKALGTPDDGDAAMGKAISIWNSKKSAKDTVLNTITIYSTTNFGDKEEAPRAQMIRVTSPFFRTVEKVGSASTLAFIKLQYPDIKKAVASYSDTAKDDTIMIYELPKEGIAFEINDAGKCIAVGIHKPGKSITNTYLPIFPGLKKL